MDLFWHSLDLGVFWVSIQTVCGASPPNYSVWMSHGKCYQVETHFLAYLNSHPDSAIKKNEIMPFSATWMDLEIIVLNEVRQRKTSTIWYHLYVESKIWHKWTYLQNRNRLTDAENIPVVASGAGRGGGMEWEFGVSKCQLLCIQCMDKVLLYSMRNYIHCPRIN